ncbi:MAG: acetyl-coenzyme A synthetase, partial [Chloroflexota bacterium]|nr:acetyl-coenzyme A synthetase [Chloroflexota bacterium]
MSDQTRTPEIEALLGEHRTFPPDPAFAAQATARAGLYDEAEKDYVTFWERLARERLSWETPFEKTLEWEPPFARWFVGG